LELDHAESACNRLAKNLTRFANDGNADGTRVDIANITFCEEFDDSIEDTAAACDEAEDDGDSRFVVVTTELRTAEYALTPIVAAFSADIEATAVAGVESAICNVAPLMVCVADDDFPTSDDIGKGIVMKTAGGNSWAPGNYGYLDFGSGNQGVINALVGFGLNGCQTTDDTVTEPGNKNATDAINTRMDVYEGTGATNNPSVCDVATGAGCPAENTRKDMTLTMTYRIRGSSAPTTIPPCGTAAGGDLTTGQISYATDFAKNPAAKNFGRDLCHYTDSCPGSGGEKNFGDAVWDRDAYIAANHPGETAASIATDLGGSATADSLTRYQVYQWEIANKATGKLDPLAISTSAPTSQGGGSNPTWTVTKQCAFNQAKLASSGYPAQKDRRVLPIVAANCDALAGKGGAEFGDFVILRVFDVFLPEPSLQRSAAELVASGIAGANTPTVDKEIYGEVIGPGEAVGGATGFQYYTRNRPYLVR
jgi:hypothetical protein